MKCDSGGIAISGCESNIERSSVVPERPRPTMNRKGSRSASSWVGNVDLLVRIAGLVPLVFGQPRRDQLDQRVL